MLHRIMTLILIMRANTLTNSKSKLKSNDMFKQTKVKNPIKILLKVQLSKMKLIFFNLNGLSADNFLKIEASYVLQCSK